MDILIVSALVLLGVLFLTIELLILPGVSIGGLLSVASDIGAAYLAFTRLGVSAGVVTIVAIILLSAIALYFSLRSKTWRRLTLNAKLESSSANTPQVALSVGDVGEAASRLAPMGRVVIKGKSYEAKSSGEYIDARASIEVVDFENSNVVVKIKKLNSKY